MRIVLDIEYKAAKSIKRGVSFQKPRKGKSAGKSFSGYKQPSDECFQNKFEYSKLGAGPGANFRALPGGDPPEPAFRWRFAAQNFRFFQRQETIFWIFRTNSKTDGFQFSVDISNLVASNDFNFDLALTVPQDYLIRK